MKRVRLDLNVFLDVIPDRQPAADVSAALWAAIERGHGQGLVPALSVAPVNEEVVKRALTLAWPDFEDAVCAAAAEASTCDALVTRDPDGYPDPPLPSGYSFRRELRSAESSLIEPT